MLEDLRRFDATHQGRASLADVGLWLLDPPEEPWGDATPVNSVVFATTGGDSVHFCLLDVGLGVAEPCPVVMVVPCCVRAPRVVVGESLREFLALGCVTGFFHLEQLAYDRDEALTYLFEWDAFVRHTYCGAPPSADDQVRLAAQRELLGLLSSTFKLQPWPEPEMRLRRLQDALSSKMRVGEGGGRTSG